MDFAEPIEDYNNAIIEFASTLQNLSLIPHPKIKTLDSNLKVTDAYEFGERLKQSVCLEELTIHLPQEFNLCKIDQLLSETVNSLENLHIHLKETPARFDKIEIFEAAPDSRRFVKFKALELERMSVFTGQDMLYIMHRFPSIRYLSLEFDRAAIGTTLQLDILQSASIMCKFMTYLSQQKYYCSMCNFTSTSQVMIKAIAQLSRLSAVTKMK